MAKTMVAGGKGHGSIRPLNIRPGSVLPKGDEPSPSSLLLAYLYSQRSFFYSLSGPSFSPGSFRTGLDRAGAKVSTEHDDGS
jgi:hypothetical protein